MASAARVAGSFRDPSGFVFSRQGVVHRQIAPSYAPQYGRLMSSGLYDEFVRREWLLPHEELDVRLAFSVRGVQSDPAGAASVRVVPVRMERQPTAGCGADHAANLA